MANIIERKSVNAGSNSAVRTGKGHFAAAAQRIAKKRSGVLQHGVPKHAPVGTNGSVGNSNIVNRGKGLTAQASESQTALNPKQQGATNKTSQVDGRVGLEG